MAQIFYRDEPVRDVRLAARRFVATNLGWRCPACGDGNVSEGFLGVAMSCPECGSRFNRLEGNELISISLSFFLACVVTFLVAFVLVRSYGFFDGITWALVAVGVATVVLALKPMRVLALWFLWLLGFVYPDELPSGARFSGRERQPRH